MNLKDLPFPVYGDTTYRGKCPKEEYEQASFFSKLRREYPDSWGLIGIHPRNEGLVKNGQFQAVNKHRLEGMTKGAADIIIPGGRGPCGQGGFVCELKRLDHTQSKWQAGQIEHLTAAHNVGAFVCVALGALAAWEAFEDWLG